jgi:hypothetical protein
VKYLDEIVITLRNKYNNSLPVYIKVFDNSLSEKWLRALHRLMVDDYHLEKNYCFMGFPNSDRNGKVILDQINSSIAAINNSNIGYKINDHFTLENTLGVGDVGDGLPGLKIISDKTNQLHRYFEDLQGFSGNISQYFYRADPTIKWHIRQLNLLCHEFESWALSYRKSKYCAEWVRPSQLMCWLNSPRFVLSGSDYELFGVDTINRDIGGVYVGVNKGVGKHHWEVFVDEANKDPDHLTTNLTTSTMHSQCEAAGDFDIEWGRNPGEYDWQKKHMKDFRTWLNNNGFDPEDKSLTIGHPKVAQVDLIRSFGTTEYQKIWQQLSNFQDVYKISTGGKSVTYDYRWSDANFAQKQIDIIAQGH